MNYNNKNNNNAGVNQEMQQQQNQKISPSEIFDLYEKVSMLNFNHNFDFASKSPGNRFANILANESTRVRLYHDKDYINANQVEYNSDYVSPSILCQGPLDETVDKMYEMCHSNFCTDIIMLCNFVETNKSKCASYFPGQPGAELELEDHSVYCLKLESHPTYEVRLLAVVRKGSNDIRRHMFVNHYWYKLWPDFGVPETDSFLPFFHAIFPLFSSKTYNFPVIHCSAGVGRSGTILLAVVSCYYALNNGNAITLDTFKELFTRTRECRAHSIQTKEQLWYAYELHYIFYTNNKPLPTNFEYFSDDSNYVDQESGIEDE